LILLRTTNNYKYGQNHKSDCEYMNTILFEIYHSEM
jgi:hypothetical protein